MVSVTPMETRVCARATPVTDMLITAKAMQVKKCLQLFLDIVSLLKVLEFG
jgi:hypothetical protein